MAGLLKAVILLVFLHSTQSASLPDLKLPSYYKKCDLNDPQLDLCIKDSIEDFIPHMIHGIREVLVPPIDPMYVEEALVEFKSDLLDGRTILKDIYAYGLSNVKIHSVETNLKDPDTFRSQIKGSLPTLRSEGKYKLLGKFLRAPINGNGFFNISMSNLDVTWTVTGKKIQRDGKTYLQITNYDVEPEVGNMKVYASNLFGGNKHLSKSLLEFVNDFWRVFYNELKPFAKESFDKILRPLANKGLTRIPFSDLFYSTEE